MKKVFSLALAALTMGAASSVHAEDLTFNLVNESRDSVVGLQVSLSSSDDWEDNLIEGYELPAGNQVDVTIADGASVCTYDILITFNSGDAIDDRGVDLCELGEYTVHD